DHGLKRDLLQKYKRAAAALRDHFPADHEAFLAAVRENGPVPRLPKLQRLLTLRTIEKRNPGEVESAKSVMSSGWVWARTLSAVAELPYDGCAKEDRTTLDALERADQTVRRLVDLTNGLTVDAQRRPPRSHLSERLDRLQHSLIDAYNAVSGLQD